jgi:hypothetical protein
MGGSDVYMTQNGGRGVTAPIYVDACRLFLREGVEVCHRQFSYGVREVVAPDVVVCPDFSQGRGVSFFPSGSPEGL